MMGGAGQAFRDGFYREIRFLRSSFWDLAFVTWMPLSLLALIAVQFESGVMRDLPIAVVDADGTGLSRELTRRLDAAPGLRLAARPAEMQAAERLVRSNAAYAIVFIPQGSERAVLRGGTARVTAFYNASHATPAGAALREIGAVAQAHGARLAVEQTAMLAGAGQVRAPSVAARTTILFNPQGSYELQLTALVHPALLHLFFMVAVASALGRELRDGTIGAWLQGGKASAAGAVAGKIALYFALFMLWSLLAAGWLAGLRGWPILGSPLLLLAGYAAMYLAYAGVALLAVGLTLSMGKALSIAGLYAGASFAFAGTIFPIEAASGFARIWSAILPYTAFAKLFAEQWMMGAPAGLSIRHVAVMLLFLAVGAAIGLPRYLAAAGSPAVWGRR